MIQWIAHAALRLLGYRGLTKDSKPKHLQTPLTWVSCPEICTHANHQHPLLQPAQDFRPIRPPVKSFQWSIASEPSRPPATRVLISGRFADVCAELDRLAALEGA